MIVGELRLLAPELGRALFFAAHAAQLKRHRQTLVSSGVKVVLGPDGEHICQVYGGQKDRVDVGVVVAAAREALADWPEPIRKIEVHVSDRKTDDEQLAAAEAKRARRAARARGQA